MAPESLQLDTTDASLPAVLEIVPASALDHQALSSRQPITVKDLHEIKSVHHRLAALLANGYKHVEAARFTGLSTSTIKSLQDSPAFKDLIAHYELCREERAGEIVSRVEVSALRFLDEIDARMDDPDTRSKIPFAVLADTAMKMLDRAGHSPVRRVEARVTSLHLAPDTLEAIRREAANVRFTPGAPGLESGLEAAAQEGEGA